MFPWELDGSVSSLSAGGINLPQWIINRKDRTLILHHIYHILHDRSAHISKYLNSLQACILLCTMVVLPYQKMPHLKTWNLGETRSKVIEICTHSPKHEWKNLHSMNREEWLSGGSESSRVACLSYLSTYHDLAHTQTTSKCMEASNLKSKWLKFSARSILSSSVNLHHSHHSRNLEKM